MEDILDIGEVARRTGLTLRGLRFYEARGLVKPLRTEGGRRIYGAGELARLNAVVAFKRAGFTLSQIGAMLDGRRIDLSRLIAAQIESLDDRAAEIAEARARLQSALCRIDRSEPIDVATLCSLIAEGSNRTMEQEKWKQVTDRYLDDTAKADFAGTPMPEGFDQEAYSAQWRDLGGRIEAALPLDPASDQAQAFLAEWQALLAPFTAVATPAMKQGVGRMYDRMGEWQGDQAAPFGPEVWAFIKAAGAARA